MQAASMAADGARGAEEVVVIVGAFPTAGVYGAAHGGGVNRRVVVVSKRAPPTVTCPTAAVDDRVGHRGLIAEFYLHFYAGGG